MLACESRGQDFKTQVPSSHIFLFWVSGCMHLAGRGCGVGVVGKCRGPGKDKIVYRGQPLEIHAYMHLVCLFIYLVEKYIALK